VLLGLAAAVFPLLLACVAILISRPNPRRLLLGFYLGGLTASVVSGILVLNRFEQGHDVLGNSQSAPHPWLSILVGAVGLLLAWLTISRRGQALIARRRDRRGRPAAEKGPSWAERRLDRANVLAATAVGAVINLPGPFYILALGDIATGSYNNVQEVGLILLFNAMMFLLLEVPLVGYLVAPAATAQRVAALSRWLTANGLKVVGAIVGLAGIGLVIQGVAAAVG
jgi:Sap-like sulfolipid-1-addressing protein